MLLFFSSIDFQDNDNMCLWEKKKRKKKKKKGTLELTKATEQLQLPTKKESKGIAA